MAEISEIRGRPGQGKSTKSAKCLSGVKPTMCMSGLCVVGSAQLPFLSRFLSLPRSLCAYK
eukprot:6628945-Prymnesium_polylepis.1